MAIKIKKPAPPAPEAQNTEEGDVLDGEIINARPVDDVPGVESVDRVVMASENAFDWIQRNVKIVAGAVVVGVVGVAAAAALMASAKEKRANDSQLLYQAYMQTIAPVGDTSDEPEIWAAGDPKFASVHDQLLAARDLASKASDGQSRGPAAFASLLAGTARLGLGGDIAPATADIRLFVKHAASPLQDVVGSLALASALAAEGDLTNALALLDDLTNKHAGTATIIGEHRASLVDAYGTPEAALAAWADVAKLAEGTAAESRYLGRVAQLNILAGNAAGVGSAPAAQDADQDSP